MLESLPNSQQTLLLKACLLPIEDIEKYWRPWREAADLDSLDDASNRLLPLLFRKLEAAGIADPWLARLRGVYRYHWCRNQILLSELRSLLAALHEAGVEVLLLKGAALIQRHYHDAGIRPMSDLDIMVRPDDMEKTFAVLDQRGWLPKMSADISKMRTRRLIHAIDFLREKNGRVIEVDVHWTPLHRSTWPGAETSFWAHALRADVNGVACRLLDPTDQLMHVCLHGGAWNLMPPFRWVADACHILRDDADAIDWDRLIADARRHNGQVMLATTLAYLHDQFAAPIPEAVRRRLASMRPTRAERLEHRLLTRQIPGARLDQLLLLEWFNHSRAFHRGGFWACLASFPNYLKYSWKLTHWHQVPGFVARRLAARLSGKSAGFR